VEIAVVGKPEEGTENPSRRGLLTLRCLACGSVARMGQIIIGGQRVFLFVF